MALFPVSSNVVQIQTATPTSSDQFSNGVRLKSDASAVFVATSGGGQISNGMLLDANGAVICVDATSGLPAGVQYVNGLPINSDGALCVSSNAVDEWINGLPFDANGALATSGLGATDPNYASVSLLLHFDGTNGSTTFTDNSPSPKTPTAAGNAQISTSQSKFGGASCIFDRSGDAVVIADQTSMRLGSGDWTIECFIRPTVIDGTEQTIAMKGNNIDTAANYEFRWITRSTGTLLQVSNGTSVTSLLGATSVPVANTWTHVAAVRTGNVLKLFINGTQSGSDTAFTGSVNENTGSFYIGARNTVGTLSEVFSGHIDEFRFTKGVARYTANFTVPTEAFPNS